MSGPLGGIRQRGDSDESEFEKKAVESNLQSMVSQRAAFMEHLAQVKWWDSTEWSNPMDRFRKRQVPWFVQDTTVPLSMVEMLQRGKLMMVRLE
jgi:hypothetical protein